MADLDDPKAYVEFDPSNMLGRISELPQQCRHAWQSAMELALPPDYSQVDKAVILGMGGSAIGGDLASALAAEEGAMPILVHRDYHLPTSIDDRTLIIASSYSGNTEETLSAFAQALKTSAKKLAITTGGRLKALAEESSIPLFTYHYLAEPRSAFGYSFFSILGILHKLGLLSIDANDIEQAIKTTDELWPKLDKDIPIEDNPAKQLATRLWGRLAVVCGAGVLSKVAMRWKTQFNENSKAWAFSECFPELDHNAVAGYRFPPWLVERVFVVLLRSPSLHPRVQARYQVTAEIMTKAGVEYEMIEAQEKGLLSQVMSTVLFGDYVSYYLAILNQVDPSPVAAIDYLKERLGKIET